MKYLTVLIFSLALLSTSAYAQDYKKHTVKKGETVASIAKQYQVTPYDIYKLNPDAKSGIKENATLLIPAVLKEAAKPKEKPTKVANTIHTVEAKETLYSLSKKYNVSVEDIQKANADALKEGLKIGQQIVIPIKGSGVAAQVKAAEKADAKKEAYIYHIVEAGETKYSIARRHGITVQMIESLNPAVKDTLPLGYNLKLVDNSALKEDATTAGVPKPENNYTVQPKETIYSISKKAGISEEELVALNPELKDGLKEGMVLKLPPGKTITGGPAAVAGKGAPQNIYDLTKSLKKSEEKEIALLLPFNMSRIESDTIRRQMLRNDRLLNITLDFYAGAMMAIDSARVLGLPLKVKILDSKENRSGSDVNGLAASLGTADAVIGPFFQGNAENAAALLAAKKIPVISPLSKDTGKPYSNLFNSVPSPEAVRMAIMDYLRSRNANVIAIVDSKKASSRDFIKANYPAVRFVDGAVTDALLRTYLVKDKPNYVILDSENTNAVLNTTKALAGALADYSIQLVVPEITDALENDEMPLDRLVKLRMLYPSVTRENTTPEGAIFAKVFREKNGIMPNQFATRGFDVTFDVILRLFQEEGFAEGTVAKASEQVENKFSYYSAEDGGNYNTGVYIMQYDEGLNTKQAE